jgi:2-dehydro-3-deoxyphosphogluconate aldolase/(4S)-4-hydroxy-2-oxoglutarate aldolase
VVSEEVIRMSRRYGKPTMCGAYTPTEVLRAWETGSDIVKVFPAELGGPAHLKALAGPLPQIPLLPTGGVRVDNVHEFFAAGAVAVGVGGNLVSKALVAAKDFTGMTRNARAFADAISAARAK